MAGPHCSSKCLLITSVYCCIQYRQQSDLCAQYHVMFAFSQDNPPYDKGAFRIEIIFPAEYPFKPPKITFKTKIYHPNIDEKGQVCLPVISAENWKPATKTDQGVFHCICFSVKLSKFIYPSSFYLRGICKSDCCIELPRS